MSVIRAHKVIAFLPRRISSGQPQAPRLRDVDVVAASGRCGPGCAARVSRVHIVKPIAAWLSRLMRHERTGERGYANKDFVQGNGLSTGGV